MKQKVRLAGICLFWLLLWQAAAMLIDNDIVFVGPASVLASLFGQIREAQFWLTCLNSLARICLGFLSAFFMALLLGAISFRLPFFKELLTPVMLLAKSVPVAAFVILALIWTGSENLSIFIAFIVVLPIIYVSTLSGLESADPHLLEMSRVFRLSFFGKIRGIYWPSLIPYLISGISSALGMSIKSGVAAEVIGVPDLSIGEKLYMAKVYLSTADLFAWTLVIILLSWLFEKLFLGILQLFHPMRHIKIEAKNNNTASESTERMKHS